jgi:hypothetical protein
MRKLANLGPVPMNYIFNKDYPLNPGDEFMGLYAEADGYAHLVLKVAKEPIFPFRFTTTNGGPPHFIGDPIAWAPLPSIQAATAPTPVEHAVSKMHGLQVPQDMMHRMELQTREFDTLDYLISALKTSPRRGGRRLPGDATQVRLGAYDLSRSLQSERTLRATPQTGEA